MSGDGLKARLIAQAIQEGFAKAGICRPDAVPEWGDRVVIDSAFVG